MGVTVSSNVFTIGAPAMSTGIFTVNKKLAVTPFPSEARLTETRNGLVINSRHRLESLRVVFSTTGYTQGATVWLRASDSEAVWAKELFEVDGEKFILIPEERIIAVRYYKVP